MAMLKSILLVLILFCFSETIQFGLSVDGSSFQCPENERSALLDFKQGLIDKTNRLSSWVGQDCCKWQGVSCNNFTGHVVKLDLRNPVPLDVEDLNKASRTITFGDWEDFDKTRFIAVGDLEDFDKTRLIAVGEVNHSLLELKHLNYLDLSLNNFSGLAIPKFFGLFLELTYLNLSGSQFGGTIPHHLGNLSALQSLDLGAYSFFDYPPLVVDTLYWSSSLVSLRQLVMRGINLSKIPLDSFQAITLLSSLLELRFPSCSLEKIPIFRSTSENLTSLKILDLSGNSFRGSIPNAIQNMTSLEILDLSYNAFQGPIPNAIPNMTSLKVLNLRFNMFNGSIFDELNNLNNLEVLDLSFNAFVGKMILSRFPNFSSPSLGDNLEILKVSDNIFVGYLPNWLKNSLKLLDLSNNAFEGEIPISFTALQSLKELHLDANKLSGRIPTSLGRMSALIELDLGDNQLSGDIPVSLGKLYNLQILRLDSNLFNGSIPKSIGGLSQLIELKLKNNQFHGLVSDLHFVRLSKLKTLDLSMKSLSTKIRSGWVPPFQLEDLGLSYCDVGPQFPDWLFTQTGLKFLYMDEAGISDSIPTWFENLTSLNELDLSRNQIYGKVPTFGIIKRLNLNSNKFEGSLPQFPSSLEFLSLSNNNINGTMPKSLCNKLSLEYLDLSNNHLLGVLPHCLVALPNLHVMDLTSNNLSGTIHQMSFCHQSKFLSTLRLSNNNFHGKFPSSLQKCTELSILDFSDNMFSGEIPTWIGKMLSSLRILKLSSNKYNSSLSPKLCHLTQLQILDIACNNLSGSIPHCIGNFRAMRSNRTDFLEFVALRRMKYGKQTFVGSFRIGRLLQVIKGRELEYTNNLRLVINLDLSNNNFVGQVPEQLTNLHGLQFLNLSRNHLIGSIPKKIGQLRLLQSLDLSNNCLSGTIPQSISDLTSLSYLNLSNNNLSRPIPLGNQLQTLNDASIYCGNGELCGLPLEKKCVGDESHPQTPMYVDGRSKGEYDGDEDKFITTWFYLGIVLGCVVGFWGFCGVLLFKKSLRYAYFRFVDDIIIDDWLFHSTATRNVGRRRRN